MEPQDGQGTTPQSRPESTTGSAGAYEFAGYRFNTAPEAWHWFHRADIETLTIIAERLEIRGDSVGDVVDSVTDAFFDWAIRVGR
jgi:hypothetical protein